MKAGIIITPWKLPIFSRHLVAAGFHYEQENGPAKETYLLTVKFEEAQKDKLAGVIANANYECRKMG